MPFIYIFNKKANRPYRHDIQSGPNGGFYVVWKNNPKKREWVKENPNSSDYDAILNTVLLTQLPLEVRTDPSNERYFYKDGRLKKDKLRKEYAEVCRTAAKQAKTCPKAAEAEELRLELGLCKASGVTPNVPTLLPAVENLPGSPTGGEAEIAPIEVTLTPQDLKEDTSAAAAEREELTVQYREQFPGFPVPTDLSILRARLGVGSATFTPTFGVSNEDALLMHIPAVNVIPVIDKTKRTLTPAQIAIQLGAITKEWNYQQALFHVMAIQLRLARSDPSTKHVLIDSNLQNLKQQVGRLRVHVLQLIGDLGPKKSQLGATTTVGPEYQHWQQFQEDMILQHGGTPLFGLRLLLLQLSAIILLPDKEDCLDVAVGMVLGWTLFMQIVWNFGSFLRAIPKDVDITDLQTYLDGFVTLLNLEEQVLDKTDFVYLRVWTANPMPLLAQEARRTSAQLTEAQKKEPAILAETIAKQFVAAPTVEEKVGLARAALEQFWMVYSNPDTTTRTIDTQEALQSFWIAMIHDLPHFATVSGKAANDFAPWVTLSVKDRVAWVLIRSTEDIIRANGNLLPLLTQLKQTQAVNLPDFALAQTKINEVINYLGNTLGTWVLQMNPATQKYNTAPGVPFNKALSEATAIGQEFLYAKRYAKTINANTNATIPTTPIMRFTGVDYAILTYFFLFQHKIPAVLSAVKQYLHFANDKHSSAPASVVSGIIAELTNLVLHDWYGKADAFSKEMLPLMIDALKSSDLEVVQPLEEAQPLKEPQNDYDSVTTALLQLSKLPASAQNLESLQSAADSLYLAQVFGAGVITSEQIRSKEQLIVKLYIKWVYPTSL